MLISERGFSNCMCFFFGGRVFYQPFCISSPPISMALVEKSVLVEYSAPRMHALVEDVARYSEFLPWCGGSRIVESADFVELAMRNVEQLAGIELSGERVDAIRCYLTGTKLPNGQFTVRRITVNDKHGIARRVYNAKVNIYRHNAEPILLGIEDRSLGPDGMPGFGSEHVLRPALDARAFSISAQTSAGKSGACATRTPKGDNASSIADAIAAGTGTTPHSPTPFTPSGFNGEGDS